MTSRPPTVLVVGGTGPTGPAVVNGLLARGFTVTILHGGLHEAEFEGRVEHVHADAHDLQALQSSLDGRTFDLGIAMYGRLRHVASALAKRVERLIAVGGVFYEGWINDQFHSAGDGQIAKTPMPPYTYPPVPMREDAPMDSNPNNVFARLALRSEQQVMDLHAAGTLSATFLRFPKVYGPRAIAPIEWSVVRRVLDRRPAIIVPDGGLALETKAYAANASAAVLAAVDHPDEAAGEIFNVGDQRAVSTREWIALLAAALDYEFELVSMPFELATPAYPYARDPWTICHHVLDTTKLRTILHCPPSASVEDGLAQTATYLRAHPVRPGSEADQQVGDPFDYAVEDRYLAAAAALRAHVASIGKPEFRYRHPYRHPAGGARAG
jgi:nucleoside-diphosphate-sugar epimerase